MFLQLLALCGHAGNSLVLAPRPPHLRDRGTRSVIVAKARHHSFCIQGQYHGCSAATDAFDENLPDAAVSGD
jgi:hypothetical protein